MTAVLSLPPGDIYNISVTACTERGSNTSTPQLVKLGKDVCVCQLCYIQVSSLSQQGQNFPEL